MLCVRGKNRAMDMKMALMVDFAEVATIEEQEWKELTLNEVDWEMTKLKVASVHAQGNVVRFQLTCYRKTNEQRWNLCSIGLKELNIYFPSP